ncbi:GNAT family N-acetyltransferase [Planococcus shixiaomingii]|uniref:GNAT family N-acetyltransferase n=1 Tax=Planococcus shixiaomingii TaxID=3058393 RepID=UPI00261AD7AB|nr:GNAT family protein [Planococcus sp. N022]WKA54614.1 GNAT family protein [Planococcus sp. N022]
MNRKPESERFYFREFLESDWTDIHEYASQAAVSQYQPWGPNLPQESQVYVNDVLTDAKKNPRTRFVFAVVLKETGKVIGAGEINVRDAANKGGEIGYIINPAFWGQGFATETAKLLLQYGFSELNLHRIYAKCDPRNTASRTVLEKIGMLKEGMMRENLLLKEGWRDSLLYALLEQEWREIFNE